MNSSTRRSVLPPKRPLQGLLAMRIAPESRDGPCISFWHDVTQSRHTVRFCQFGGAVRLRRTEVVQTGVSAKKASVLAMVVAMMTDDDGCRRTVRHLMACVVDGSLE